MAGPPGDQTIRADAIVTEVADALLSNGEEQQPAPKPVATGTVDTFTATEIAGRVRAEQGRATRVTLAVNGQAVTATWALPIEGAASPRERAFFFTLSDIWKFVGPDDRLQLLVDGAALPLASGGDTRVPDASGRWSPDMLLDRLGKGFLFNKKGKLQLSKLRDLVWQAQILSGYDRLRHDIERVYGYTLFPAYGSMLGAVREAHFIGNDDDFDCAYISGLTDPAALRDEMKRIAVALVRLGYDVWLGVTCIHVEFAPGGKAAIDIFNAYFDADARLVFPFGTAGSVPYRRDDLTGWIKVPLADRQVVAPTDPEKLLAWIYGPGWRVPDPTFNWARERRLHEPAAFPSRQDRRDVHWEQINARAAPGPASDLARMLADKGHAAGHAIVDLGCGLGADARLVATRPLETTVLGLDLSSFAIERAQVAADAAGLRGVRFERCDVSDPVALAGATAAMRAGERPITYLIHRLVNALPPPGERRLFEALTAQLRPGDRIVIDLVTEPAPATASALRKAGGRARPAAAVALALRTAGLTVAVSRLTTPDGDKIGRLTCTLPFPHEKATS